MCMLGYFSSIAVHRNFPLILFLLVSIFQITNIITNRQNKLICHKMLIHQIKCQKVCHFLNDQSGLLKIIWAMQYLSGTNAVTLWFIGFDLSNRTRFPPPCVINEKLCIYPKQPIQQFFIIIICFFSNGTSRHISHVINAMRQKFFCVSLSDPPKIRNWLMRPKQTSVTDFIEFCNSDPIMIWFHMFCQNVHGNFTKIQVRSNSRSRSHSHCIVNVPDYF